MLYSSNSIIIYNIPSGSEVEPVILPKGPVPLLLIAAI